MNGKQVAEIVDEIAHTVTESTKQVLVKEIVRELKKGVVSRFWAPGKKVYDEEYDNALRFVAEQYGKILCEKYLGHDFSIWSSRVGILDKREEVAVCAVCQTVNHMLRRYTAEDGSWEIIDRTGERNTLVSRSEPVVV